MKIKTKKNLMIIGVILCILIILASLFFGVRKIVSDYQSQKEYTELTDETVIKEEEENNSQIPLIVDFAKLKEINEDIIGWIYIPCIQVSYPILQSVDNEFYLHRTATKKQQYAGSIFLDMSNSNTFTDPNSIIYGHNMLNGTMFGKLWHIPQKNAAQDNPYFWILTPEKAYRYQIFSAYDTRADSQTYRFFATQGLEFRNWCYEMRDCSMIDFGEYPFNQESRIVTLSTCLGTSKTERTIVQGVQEKAFDYYTEQATDIPFVAEYIQTDGIK